MALKVAIVGNRDYPEPSHIRRLIDTLPEGTIIYSGGARGVDTWAAQYGKAAGYEVIEITPDVPPNSPSWMFAKAAYARNQKIVESCDIVYAFISHDGGGTANTLKHAKTMKRPFFVRDWRL